MSKYYNPKRTKNLYDSNGLKPFKLSRSKIALFIDCPFCFYLDRRLGVGRPPGFSFNLNSAVDSLLKKEFDINIISYEGNDSWIDNTIKDLYACLNSDKIPESNKNCNFCNYRKSTIEEIC